MKRLRVYHFPMRTAVIINSDFSNWVLGGIGRDICEKGQFKLEWVNFRKLKSRIRCFIRILISQKLIFINQETYKRMCRFYYYFLMKKKIYILYTHTNLRINENFNLFKGVNIVCINTSERDLLVSQGVKMKQIVVCPTGVDFSFFLVPNGKPQSNRVLLVSSYKKRKNPKMVLGVVSRNLDFEFTLIGLNWEFSKEFVDLKNLPNFTYLQFSYPTYTQCLEENHIFLSLSSLEGGPLPMLETMACNLIPVCTETGWANDVIEDGENGFILKENYTSSDVRTALMKAKIMDLDVRSTVKQYTYERYIDNFIN